MNNTLKYIGYALHIMTLTVAATLIYIERPNSYGSFSTFAWCFSSLCYFVIYIDAQESRLKELELSSIQSTLYDILIEDLLKPAKPAKPAKSKK